MSAPPAPRVPSSFVWAAAGLVAAGCGARTDLLVGDAAPPTPEDAGAPTDADLDGGPRPGPDACVPEPEVCNDRDDDCDGAVDDGTQCFFLNGAPLEPLVASRCGADWYAYDDPDTASANPTPDIRIPEGIVIATQVGPTCDGAHLALIADSPGNIGGGRLSVTFVVDPPGVDLAVSDEPGECLYDRDTGIGSCAFIWQTCCTDGLLLGPLREDGCVTLRLSGAMAVGGPVVLEGSGPAGTPVDFDEPFEICTEVRPEVP